MNYKKYPENVLNHYISLPFIGAMIVPVIILDFFVELYQNVCFRLYGIPLVDRSKYIKIDRHRLSYLPFVDKISCAYCGYANGVLGYASKIAAETEAYWCGIKHKTYQEMPTYHDDFLEYGDQEAYFKLEKKDVKNMEKV